MQKKVGGADGIFDMAVATNPENAVELDTCPVGGSWMKAVEEIDYRADFATEGGLSQNVKAGGGAGRGTRTVYFNDDTAR